MYKKIITFFLIIGIIFIVVNVSKYLTTRKNTIIYKYIPRSFDEEQMKPGYVSDIFKTLFSQPSVWERGIGQRNENSTRTENINDYFISQY